MQHITVSQSSHTDSVKFRHNHKIYFFLFFSLSSNDNEFSVAHKFNNSIKYSGIWATEKYYVNLSVCLSVYLFIQVHMQLPKKYRRYQTFIKFWMMHRNIFIHSNFNIINYLYYSGFICHFYLLHKHFWDIITFPQIHSIVYTQTLSI